MKQRMAIQNSQLIKLTARAEHQEQQQDYVLQVKERESFQSMPASDPSDIK